MQSIGAQNIRPLSVVAWESTQACNLACRHCRASAQPEPSPDELTTAEVQALIDDIASFAHPVFIISGGEPLMRKDVLDIARYAQERGLRPVISPNGTLITPELAAGMVSAGISRVSVSIDGSSAARHDAIRGVPGAFDAALHGLGICRDQQLSFQLNTTVLRQTVDDLPAIHRLAVELGAAAWHVFMLVPTGRGQAEDEVTGTEYERVLNWVYEAGKNSPIPIRVTCGPHYMRIAATRSRQEGGSVQAGHPGVNAGGRGGQGHADRMSRGCLAGNGYCFVSHRGEVFPCGYFPLAAGDIRQDSFARIYQESALFQTLRDWSRLEGKCGRCEFVGVCGGCRARAYSTTGNMLAEEPFCSYQPRAERRGGVDRG